MNDIDLGATLSPDEQSYFDTGGQTEIHGGDSGNRADAGNEGGGESGGQQQANDANKAATDDNGQRQASMVPHAAVHEERTRRKAVEQQNRDLEKQLAELKGKFSIIDRLAAPPPRPEPTVNDDIFAVVENTARSVQEMRQQQQEQREAAERAAREQSQRDEVVRAYQLDAAQFESKTPDFKAAYNHLLQSRAQELMALGYEDPQTLHQALMADEFAIAQMALQGRRSPAEVIYNLARQRGYQPATGKGSAADKIDTIARGQQAGKSLTGAGGAPVDAEMSAEALLKMPMDEFEAWCAKNPAKAKRIMGG